MSGRSGLSDQRTERPLPPSYRPVPVRPSEQGRVRQREGEGLPVRFGK